MNQQGGGKVSSLAWTTKSALQASFDWSAHAYLSRFFKKTRRAHFSPSVHGRSDRDGSKRGDRPPPFLFVAFGRAIAAHSFGRKRFRRYPQGKRHYRTRPGCYEKCRGRAFRPRKRLLLSFDLVRQHWPERSRRQHRFMGLLAPERQSEEQRRGIHELHGIRGCGSGGMRCGLRPDRQLRWVGRLQPGQ